MDGRYLGRFETEGFRGSDQEEVELGEMRDVISGKLPGEFARSCSYSPSKQTSLLSLVTLFI